MGWAALLMEAKIPLSSVYCFSSAQGAGRGSMWSSEGAPLPRLKGCPVDHPENSGDREHYCHIKIPDFSRQLSSSILVTFSENPTEPETGISHQVDCLVVSKSPPKFCADPSFPNTMVLRDGGPAKSH